MIKRYLNDINKMINEVKTLTNINSKYKSYIVMELEQIKKTISDQIEIFKQKKLNINDNDNETSDSDVDDESNASVQDKNEIIENNTLLNTTIQNNIMNAIKQKTENAFVKQIKPLINAMKLKVNETKNINKNKNMHDDFNKYCKDCILPSRLQILGLKHASYMEKKQLLDMKVKFFEAQGDEKIKLRDAINFRFRNLKNIKTKKHAEKYKRGREFTDISYKDVLDNQMINDDETAHLIKRINTEHDMLNENFDSSILTLKQVKYEIINGEWEHTDASQNSLSKKINESMIPESCKKKLICMLKSTETDVPKTIEYINYALKIPFNKIEYSIPDSTNVLYKKFKTILDETLYGMEKVKEELITTICCRFNKNIKYNAIGLMGPPGVGKTTIGRSIAKVFNAPFEQISMNSVSNGVDLTGNNFAFIGAQPGRITKALIRMKCINGVLFLDEIDKTNGNSDDSVSNALMNILDFGQNNEYVDNYFPDFKIDLSNLLIICSFNNIEKIDKIIADRIKIIKIEGYTQNEKIEISKLMIKKCMNDFTMSDEIIFTNDIIKYIINKCDEYDRNLGCDDNHGVRSVERAIKHIIERIKILINTIDNPIDDISYKLKNFSLPYTLTQNSIDILLKNFVGGSNKFNRNIGHMYL